jgi:twitching motility protein PilJ
MQRYKRDNPMENSTAKANIKDQSIRWWGLTAVCCVLATLFNLGFLYYDNQRDQERLETLASLQLEVRRMVQAAQQALDGDMPAFELLQREQASIQQDISLVATLSIPDKGFSTAVLTQALKALAIDVEAISSGQDRLMLLHTDAAMVAQALPTLRQQWADIMQLLLRREAPSSQIMVLNEQLWLSDRMLRQLDHLGIEQNDSRTLLTQFTEDAAKIEANNQDLLRGSTNIPRLRDDTARGLLSSIDEQWRMMAHSIRQIGDQAVIYDDTKTALTRLQGTRDKLEKDLALMVDRVKGLADTRTIGLRSMMALGLLSLALLVVVFLKQRQFTALQLAESEAVTQRNQQAILRLLDELADLADGDLTVSASVTEDFTGAIADSINFTVDQLRVLVSNINDTAVNVSTAAQDSQATALQLAKASEHQAHEIAGASAAINEMAVTIDQVSLNAEESARVADRSVALADTGANVVRNTIDGMDTIREQIQDTAKRIKRLGESSQEIGDIISLINDIADQTNILALNAAIQASMAGDAGRGFAVVADEVQRLAERSSAATRQIEALVKTIQNDTSEAVISMEKTTADVVRGAKLANDAGVALAEIEEVSGDLAELIQNISNAARQQASSANHISSTMNVIQDITSQTAQGTTATASAIGNLSELANQLRSSVAGFKLPEKSTYQPEEVGVKTLSPKHD